MASDLVDPLRAEQPVQQPRLGVVGTLRWAWRQLTSMRTALLLLFLLALASVPGSVFPQRGVAPLQVTDYFREHPTAAPILDRLSMFDVYAAPWFAAIYLLLMVSLAGCIVPRVRQHWRTVRAQPPAAPRNLERLPASSSLTVDALPEDVVDRAAKHLRSSGFRVRLAPDRTWVASEKGYAREVGNLVFHLALLVMLVGVALGSLYGYRGTVLVVEGEGFANTLTQYDDFTPGRQFAPSQQVPFSFVLDDFEAVFVEEGPRLGQPESFIADVTVVTSPGAEPQEERIEVNHPLVVDGTKVFLLGHGYAPEFTVRDGTGEVVFAGPSTTLPQDAAFTSRGVLKVPDAQPEQLGFEVTFTPTAPGRVDPVLGPASTFPEVTDPAVFLGGWVGDLGLDDGEAQSVYRLQTEDLEQIGLRRLAPGETWQLPGDRGSITFDGYREWANFQVARDPGGWLVLAASVAVFLGVITSLTVRRRRVWVRATLDEEGRTLVRAGALARTETSGLDDELDALLQTVKEDP